MGTILIATRPLVKSRSLAYILKWISLSVKLSGNPDFLRYDISKIEARIRRR